MSEADVNSGIAQTDIKISLPFPFPMVVVKINDAVDFVKEESLPFRTGRFNTYKKV